MYKDKLNPMNWLRKLHIKFSYEFNRATTLDTGESIVIPYFCIFVFGMIIFDMVYRYFDKIYYFPRYLYIWRNTYIPWRPLRFEEPIAICISLVVLLFIDILVSDISEEALDIYEDKSKNDKE